MRILSPCLLGVVFLASAPTLTSQEGKVVVVYPDSKELKRTARRLRINTDQLKNARTALEEATGLAAATEPFSPQPYSTLGRAWAALYRSRAVKEIEGMLARPRDIATGATDLQQYRDCSDVAYELIAALSTLDNEKATELSRQWPKPPASLGPEAEKIHDSMQENCRSRILSELSWRDPVSAMPLLPDLSPNGRADYWLRARLAQQLAAKGQLDQSRKIVEQVFDDFAQRNPDRNVVEQYIRFLKELPGVDAERLSDGIALLVRAASAPAITSGRGKGTLRIGDFTVELTYSEAMILDLLKEMRITPELTLKTIEAFSGLKDKLARVGGIDTVMSGGYGRGMGFRYDGHGYGVGQQSYAMAASDGKPGSEDLIALQKDLMGKAFKNPSYVRQRLSHLADEPGKLDLLLNLAEASLYTDDDLAAIAVDCAHPLLLTAEPLTRRLEAFRRFMVVSRRCDGDVDPDLLRQGFILADEIREVERKKNPETTVPTRLSRAADDFELSLIAEVARSDFNRAMAFAHAMSDSGRRLTALLRILDTLAQSSAF